LKNEKRRGKMKKRAAIILVVCLVVIGIVLGVVFSRGASPQSTPTTVNVTRGDIVKTVLVDGNLEMPNKAYLSFGTTGTVTEVLVSEGDNVTKDEVLARLDAQSLNSSVEVAELQVKIAQDQVEAAQAQYEIAQINLDKGVLGQSEDVLEQQVNIAEANWETAKMNLKIAKLNLESAKLNLDKAMIVAPFDGVVADVSITEGEQISTTALATPAISLVDTSEIEMQGYIDELDVAMVKLGQAANITLDALPDEQVTGSVTFISPISTVRAGIVSYATTITLENLSAELKDGMSATAEVVVERRDNVLLVPNTVIQGILENPMVVVLVDGQQEQRPITLGLSDGFNTEVLSGLEEGEEVVVPAPTSTQQSGGFFGM
jgi:macrolide-specific efflux system membrane fusion protein